MHLELRGIGDGFLDGKLISHMVRFLFSRAKINEKIRSQSPVTAPAYLMRKGRAVGERYQKKEGE